MHKSERERESERERGVSFRANRERERETYLACLPKGITVGPRGFDETGQQDVQLVVTEAPAHQCVWAVCVLASLQDLLG